MNPHRDRNALFLELKPCCVRLSKLAIGDSFDPAISRQMLDLTSQLQALLEEQVEQNPEALDEKLAEYVFFPLHHIFRQMDRFPLLMVENCLKCLRILIVYGWKSKISARLVQQIQSLLTFIIDGKAASATKRQLSEETILESFRTQTALFKTAALSSIAAAGLAEQDAIPMLGHSITVILDGAGDGPSPLIQQEALHSLEGLYATLRDHEAMASFLPGIVSSLTKILSLPNRYKTTVLVEVLRALQMVLIRVLGDLRTRSVLARSQGQETDTENDEVKTLSPAWLNATVSQVKLALSSVMKLRTIDASPVREALGKLCIALLDECHKSLSNCTSVLVETSMMLDIYVDRTDPGQTSLHHLIGIYPELGETVKVTLYNWLSSLPRVMQTDDDDKKRIAVQNLANGIALFRSLGLESKTLDESLSLALKDSMVSLLLSPSSQKSIPDNRLQLHDDALTLETLTASEQFQPVLLARESHRELRTGLMSLIDALGSASRKADVAAGLMESVRESSSADQVAAMWLCFELIKAADQSSGDAAALLDLSLIDDSAEDTEVVFNDLYAFAVHVLEAHADWGSRDWRSEALSMEVAAYAARKLGRSYRPELIDVLFPIATFLGSDKAVLQHHAITALNDIASSAQYSSVSDLIIENVDYMVNSVALRLNTLDISPASMQVLLMMVRLAGPRLIPFLDDVVDSIFAALENYHGYPVLVESLFAILKEMVDQGSRADQSLLIEGERAVVNHKKQPLKLPALDSVLEFLDKRKARKEREAAEAASDAFVHGHPEEPWKSTTTASEDDHDGSGSAARADLDKGDEKPPSSPTYQLVLRIAYLTQHYLTSASPTLRKSLLELVSAASKLLAGDEDSFLPLVNAVWPVVISRLYDSEAFVAIEACNALSSLCEGAGDFMSSRFKTEWADRLHKWCRTTKQQSLGGSTRFRASRKGTATAGEGGSILIPIPGGLGGTLEQGNDSESSLGQHASPARIWAATVKLLTSIVSYVRVEDQMFDDILDLLSDVLETNGEVREALETINADAVWLVRYERGHIEPLPTPEGADFVAMKQL
ncbi:hypothetical protein L249_2970 [Ophiocordyceps polyrhachis-furcata BCC 54312]|uniref:HEAT repeat protein n=1 Tax=Ophiocordyceps polyrhachis-furcata BCC 54312 TaxID=1330021 RepID=A0A367LMY8_9HYPO|nr:hypothetical protein L249_2970 [Ophiocordyceps polyrhachis-furcata BCC 54312]